MKHISVCSTTTLFLLSFTIVCGAQTKAIVVKKDLVFGNGGDTQLKLDLAMPKDGDGPFPAIVCIHGGGWRSGNRQQLDKVIEELAPRGYVAVTISYRLTPKAKFPAQVYDCKAAVRWLRANAEKYKIDAERIGAVGLSAGGHLVCLLGTADKKAGLEGNGGNGKYSSRVQAVVCFFGPTDFTTKTWEKGVEDFFLVPFLGGTFEKAKKTYRKASPIVYVSNDDPPFLFFHGTKDPLVKIRQSRIMVKKLKEVGVPARLEEIEGAGHGWGGAQLIRTLRMAEEFFDKHLKRK